MKYSAASIVILCFTISFLLAYNSKNSSSIRFPMEIKEDTSTAGFLEMGPEIWNIFREKNNFKKIVLRDIDLSDMNLLGYNFKNLDFEKTDFSIPPQILKK